MCHVLGAGSSSDVIELSFFCHCGWHFFVIGSVVFLSFLCHFFLLCFVLCSYSFCLCYAAMHILYAFECVIVVMPIVTSFLDAGSSIFV